MDSVNPEVVIFTGALDTKFKWDNKIQDGVLFSGSLTNAITCANNTKVRKFIFISSCDLFDGSREIIIHDTSKPATTDEKSATILLGENICSTYEGNEINSIAVVRVDEVYGTYNKLVMEDNICFRLCEKALLNEEVEIIPEKKHNLIFVDDVIDCIFKVVSSEFNSVKFYNISSQCSYTENEMLHMVEKVHNSPTKAKTVEGDSINHIYSIDGVKKLGYKEKYNINDEINNIYRQVKANIKKNNKKNENSKTEGEIFTVENKNKIRPFIETMVLFILIQIIAALAGDTLFFKTIDIYLLFVIFMGVCYGSIQAIFSTILSFIGKVYIATQFNLTSSIFNDEYIYLWTIQIFLIATLTGYMKDKYKRKYEDWKDEKAFLESELKIIKDVNESNVKAKNIYESRLINYKDSLGKIYSMVSKLDELEPEKIIFKAVSVISEVINCKDVAIYSCDKNTRYARLIASSSEAIGKNNKSLKLNDMDGFMEKLKNKEIYINKMMDKQYPKMAAGTYNNGKLEMIICIWSLPFEANNLYSMNKFGVICKLIEKSLLRAHTYLQSIYEATYDTNYGIMKMEAFDEMLKLYNEGKKENLLEFTLLQVKSYANMAESQFFNVIKNILRETDHIGLGKGKEVYVLLTNSNKEEAEVVISRLQKKNIDAEIVSERINEVAYE